MFKVKRNEQPCIDAREAHQCKDTGNLRVHCGVKRNIIHVSSSYARLKQPRFTPSSCGNASSNLRGGNKVQESWNSRANVFGESIVEEMKRDGEDSRRKSCSNVFEERFETENLRESASVWKRARDVEPKNGHRDLVKKKILEGLWLNGALPLSSPCDFNALAARIEAELHEAFASSTKEYTRKARSILHNLNDVSNLDFRMMLAIGFIRPKDVPYLSPEQMGSYERLHGRTRLKKTLMDEARSDWELSKGILQTSSLFSCDACGGSNTTYFQLQTRTCDEPETTYVMCLDCRKRWKC